MRLLSKQQFSESITTGQLSDGSDRATAIVQRWQARVLDDLGRPHDLAFDHDPTDAEIQAALPSPPELAPTSRADYERGPLNDRYEAWWRWKQTRVEAQARGAAAPVVAALTNREDAAWAAYLVTLNAWRAAT